MGFLAPAAPFIPMLVGAGVGAIADKDNPLRGAMLGAVGGQTLAPLATAGLGLGTAAGETALAAMPASAMAGADAAGMAAGLPSMEVLAGTMPGGMAAPGVMGANGMPFAANAATAATAYNAMPIADRVSALFHKPQLSPKGAMRMAGNMIQGQPQQAQASSPAVAGASPPRSPPPYQPVRPFVTGMPSMNRRKQEDPIDRYWGYS
jgi:hypothetical protein